MGLFSDFYNTVARFFRPQEDVDGASKEVATNRLKLVLMQDRTNLTPKILEQMRGELVDLLSKYLEMDKDLLELNFEQEGDQVALMLSIPVIRAKDEEEIEAALAAEAEAKSEDTSEETEEELDEDEEFEDDELVEEELETAEVEAEITSNEAALVENNTQKHKNRRRKLAKVSSPEGLTAEEKTEEVSETEQVTSENTEG